MLPPAVETQGQMKWV